MGTTIPEDDLAELQQRFSDAVDRLQVLLDGPDTHYGQLSSIQKLLQELINKINTLNKTIQIDGAREVEKAILNEKLKKVLEAGVAWLSSMCLIKAWVLRIGC